MERITTAYFRKCKQEGKKITMLTAYDYPMAKLEDENGIEAILVGDSVGNNVLGYESSIPVTMDDMLHHVKAVCRGVQRALVVADMPFLSYTVSKEEALHNAGRFLQEGGAGAVKLEGGREVAETVQAMTQAGIPVMGHLGLTPQAFYQMGGYQVQGKSEGAALKLWQDAQALQQAGVFALVLECVPAALASFITQNLKIAVIGIGGGAGCDGQILVVHDLLGFYSGKSPKFSKRYLNLNQQIAQAFAQYKQEVEEQTFPAAEHEFSIDAAIMEKLARYKEDQEKGS